MEPKAQDYQIEDDQSSQEKGEIRLPQQEYEEPEVTVKTWVVTGVSSFLPYHSASADILVLPHMKHTFLCHLTWRLIASTLK